MAKIALRAYNQEIDSLIEARQIDEAIAHCRHILKTFPKHIQTYRLLGKAFLESQRYGDAADILQRVLSSIPDDFIAQVGMSVIREDEGNLAEAIYHMERAFEVQPANRAIQEELRRLYGKRDGFEPPKVRLSRGALARMYAKGELYTQAISELRAALAENPDRLDLRLLLARNFMRMGQRVEAADACNLLLRKLPYCLEANQIMADVLQNSERAADATAYRRRVAALDPYEAHVSALMPDAGRVPDGTVTVERLSWQPGMPIAAGDYQPEWAASLGVHVPEEYPGLDEFPDWLGGNQPAADAPAAAPGPALVDEDGVTPLQAEAAEIPDWMQKAGWKPGSGAEQAEAAEFEDEDEDLLAGMDELSGLPEAELPDWVKEMAPQDGMSETQASEWVSESDLAGEAGDTAPQSEAELGELLEETPSMGEPPDWLSELAESEDQPPQPGEMVTLATDETRALHPPEAEAEMPDWLEDLAHEATGSVEPAAALEPEAVPDWLSEAGPAEAEPVDEVVEWLAGAAPLAGLETTPAEEELPDWVRSASEVEAETDYESAADMPQVEAPQGEDIDAALAWLEGLAAKQGADEALFTAPEDRPEAPPEWVAQSVAQDADELFTPETGAAVPAEALPDWLDEAPGELGEAVEAAAEPAEEIPDWLKGAAAAAGAVAGVSGVAADATRSLGEDSESEAAEAEESIAAFAEPAEELPDWLQAAKAEAEENAEAVAEPAEEIPDWVQAAATEAEETVEAAAEPVEELPDWLQIAKTEAEETIEAVAEPVEEIPDWVQAAATEAEETIEAAEEPAEELPDWLQAAKAEAEENAEAVAEPVEELPDWVQAAATEAEETVEAAAAPAEEIPDWLKGIAGVGVAGAAASATRSLGEDAESDIDAAEAAPAEELPEWLQEARAIEAEAEETTEAAVEALPNLMEEAQAAAEAAGEPAAAAEAWELETAALETPAGELGEAEILPDWLKDLQAEGALEASVAEASVAEVVDESGAAEMAGMESLLDEWQVEATEASVADVAAADDWLAALETPVEEGDTKPGRTMLATQLDYAELGLTPSEPVAEEAELAPAESEALLAEELPDWLQEMAPATAVESAALEEKAEYAEDEFAQLFAEPEESVAETPAWEVAESTLPETTLPEVETAELLEIEEIEAEELEAALLAEEIAPGVAPDTEEDAFLSLFSEAEESMAETVEAEPVAVEAEPAESLPDWLQELSPAAEAEEIEEVAEEAEAVRAEAIPDWLEEITPAETAVDAVPEMEAASEVEAEPVQAAPEAEAALPSIDISQEAAEMPDFGDDMEAAFAWLEGLAAKQGAQEALFTAPEDRPEAPPEWVAAAVEEIPPFEAAVETPAGLPEDLEAALAEDLEAAEALEMPLEVDATSEVEVSLEAEEPAEVEASAEAVATPEALDVQAAWQSVEDFVPVDEEVEPEAEVKPELPAWLEEVGSAETEAAPEAEALDVKAAWQGVEDFVPVDEEVVLEEEVKPELPAWLQEVEQVETEAAPEAETWMPPSTPEVEAVRAEPVDLNKAGLVDLERLPGIGFTLAQKILDQRDQTGPFNSVMDLGQIAGITPEMLAELEGWVTVETPRPGISAPHVRVEGPEDLLVARQSLLNGDLDGSLEQYSKLIRARRFLPDILRDLQQAVEANPRQPEFWQALGDAYLRDDQVQPALEAYTKVEELLR